ncbi:MAG: CPBP family intramembrane metalloprotease [Caulobacteraceae bacterium]|nr:CPBP family intramembrane metalloprotease [Caulobacteraceae bacterium]
MRAGGVWTGLGGSTFVAGALDRERRPVIVAATIAVGLAVGFVVATASWILTVVPYTILSGQGGRGVRGLEDVAAAMADLARGGIDLAVLRLLVATLVDGGFLLGFVAVAAALARHPLASYVTTAPRIRWRLGVVGLVLALIALAPFAALDRVQGAASAELPLVAVSASPGGRLLYGLAALLLIPAAAAEELFFRGWMLRQVAAFTRQPAVLIGATALVFSGLHFDFSPDGFVTRAVMGAGFAYMTLRLGGVEFAAGVHAANNILIVLFLQPLTLEVAQTPGLNLASLAEDVALIGAYVLITEIVARSPAVRRWAHVSDGQVSPAPERSPRPG